MLCEKCKTAEATVHITEITEVVANAPGEMKKRELCEACFSQSDLGKKVNAKTAGWTSYGPGATATILPNDEPDR